MELIIQNRFKDFFASYRKNKLLIRRKKYLKKEFVAKLQSLSPKLYATGEVPSEQTIYRYLNGSRELKVELIPYIAEVLEVTEQDLFNFDIEYASNYNIRFSKEIREIIDLLPHTPINVISYINWCMGKRS